MQSQASFLEAYEPNFNCLDIISIRRDSRAELDALRDENFNLKLHIYLLEESQASAFGSNMSKEFLTRELNKANTLILELQNSIDEKVDILKDVQFAIVGHQSMHTSYAIESESKIAQLEECIRNLELKLKKTIGERPAAPNYQLDSMHEKEPLDTPIKCVKTAHICNTLDFNNRHSVEV